MTRRLVRVVGALAAAAVLAVLPAAPAAAVARDITQACPEGTPESGFSDTAELSEAQQAAIDCIVAFEITFGTTATTYSPGEPVVRGQMASFLERTVGVAAPELVPSDPPDAFGDDDGDAHESAINVVAALGIAKGSGPGTFSPGLPVSRAQMASFVARTIEVVTGAALGSAPDAFSDDDGNTHEPAIDALAALGIVQGVAVGSFEPDATVTRVQMALFLARTLDHLAEEGHLDGGDGGGQVRTLAVAGEHELLQVGGTRTCVVTASEGEAVHLRLLPVGDVTTADDGTLRFADANDDGLADTRPVAASITDVDGTAQPPETRAVDDVPGGEISVTLGATGEGEVVLVAFIDGEVGTAHALDVDPDGAPVDEAAAGCRTAFVPPEAAQGARADVIVNTVGADATYFTGAPQGGAHATYMVDDGDEATGKATSVEGLRALLSAGDVIDIDYDPTPEGASTFDVTFDTVRATAKPTTVAIDHTEDGGADDVRVAFVPPDHNGAGTEYRIIRLKADMSAEGDCLSSTGTGLHVGTTDASPFIDVDVPDGCWRYRTVAASPTGATATSLMSDPLQTPGAPPDTIRPLSVHASVADDGDGVLGVGDVITIAFDEVMADPAEGATLRVTEGGVSVTFTYGTDADFTRLEVAVIVGGEERPARTVIEVRPTSDPSAELFHPTTIAAHTGVTDLAGNAWDIAQSPDRTLETES